VTGYLTRLSGDVRRDAPEPARGFGEALRAGGDVAVIAEIKRASPSEGGIAPDADVSATARRYADGGAAAMSVLVAERDFGGGLDDLRQARAAAGLPALAKEFTVFPEQVAAQRTAGADAILVLLALVSDGEAARLLQTAELLGMDALVEAHTAGEVERALALEVAIVGVNARDLESLEVDRDRQLGLLARLPRSVTRVAESGIAARADVEAARDAGADAVLVGTSLMRRPELLAELVGVAR
jgi:indole-3-glycerol phosphate synthase